MKHRLVLKNIMITLLLVFSLAPIALADEAGHSIKMLKNTMTTSTVRDEPPAWLVPFTLKPRGTSIFGAPEVSIEQCAAYIKKVNPNPKLQCSVEELVKIYYEEASLEGIRPDLALAQAIKETGFFKYGGDVLPEQNNYCGLGTTGGGVRGAYFASPRIGVRAQIQHLLGYATSRPPFYPIVDPRYELLKTYSQKFARCSTWQSLDGNWAVPGVGYGNDIVRILENIKASAS